MSELIEERQCDVAVVGAGPAGLMAAEVLAMAGLRVKVFDAKPSPARKFLMAGKGGLNLTHSEPAEAFVSRYGRRAPEVASWLDQWGPGRLRDWVEQLGFRTFVGSSGRVFPEDMKAAPMLRAWLLRLKSQGVGFHMRHRWQGVYEQGRLELRRDEGVCHVTCRAVVLTLGGGSWAKLGSDGAWQSWLAAKGVELAPLQPANCGFDVKAAGQPTAPVRTGWSPYFAERFAGQPFKSVALSFDDGQAPVFSRQGEFVATMTGVEGSLIYAVSARLREAVARQGEATFHLDLLPQTDGERVLAEVARPRGSRSLGSHLKGRLGIEGIKAALLHEVLSREEMAEPARLAQAIKRLPITVSAPRPMDEAISTAGGVRLEALDENGMCRAWPGVFCAGEMLDWEAPTGGYLLTACMSNGRHVGQGVLKALGRD